MKITGGLFKGQSVKTLNSNDVRPTSSKVRESIFNIIQSSIAGSVMLDLFAGSGIMGIESLSRGAKKTVFVEKNPKVYKNLKENLSNFEINNECYLIDAVKFLEKFNNNKFDIIFIDPPYRENLYEPVLKKIKERNILNESGIIILEHLSTDNFQELAKSLGYEIIKEKKYGDTALTILK